MRRRVTDYGGGAGNREHVVAGEAHGAGKTRRRAAVLARIAPGADLTRIFHALAGLIAGQQVNLQPVRRAMMTDGAGRGKAVGEEIAHAGGATVAELLVALGIARAFIDGAEVIPQAQHMSLRALFKEVTKLGVGCVGGAFGAIVLALVQFDRCEKPAAAGRPAQGADRALGHRGIDLPDLQRRRRVEAFQRDLKRARVTRFLAAGAEAEQGQRAGFLQRGSGIADPVGHARGAAQKGIKLRVFTSVNHAS